MKNKNLTLLLLGLGALLIFTKKDKKETEGEDDKATPDVGNGKNDVSKDATTDVVVVDATEDSTPPKSGQDTAAPTQAGTQAPMSSPYMY